MNGQGEFFLRCERCDNSFYWRRKLSTSSLTCCHACPERRAFNVDVCVSFVLTMTQCPAPSSSALLGHGERFTARIACEETKKVMQQLLQECFLQDHAGSFTRHCPLTETAVKLIETDFVLPVGREANIANPARTSISRFILRKRWNEVPRI